MEQLYNSININNLVMDTSKMLERVVFERQEMLEIYNIVNIRNLFHYRRYIMRQITVNTAGNYVC